MHGVYSLPMPYSRPYCNRFVIVPVQNILHTEKARKMCKKYLIGKIEGKEPGNLFASEEESDTGANSLNQVEPTAMNTYVTIGFLVAAAALAYKFYLVRFE